MPERETVKTDVLIVGGGPAGLASAIHLSDLIRGHNQAIESGKTQGQPVPANILLIEKGSSMGSHTLSGAVINPSAIKELLPEVDEKDIPFESPVTKDEVWLLTQKHSFRIPFHPPYMSNKGNYIASLGKIVRWLSEVAEKKGVEVFPGFAGAELLYDGERVAGIRTGDTGLDKHGNQMANYQPGNNVHAKMTVLAEGTRGHLTKKLIGKLNLAKDRNPQVYSIGVKEVWEVPEEVFEPGQIAHTLNYPLTYDHFGGGFIYGMAKGQVAVGLVAGLDYRDPTFDPHSAFQIYKKHPFVAKILEKGRMIRYGAKTIPEGGLFALPKLYADGAMIVGDAAGFLSMPSLKGIHLGIQSGMLAAKTAFEALKKGDYSRQQLELYEELFKKSPVYKDLYRVRNFRQAFKVNLPLGAVQFGAQLFTGGHGLSISGRIKMEEDFKSLKPLAAFNGRSFQARFKEALQFDKKLTFDKATDLFYSGTRHDEEQPCHLQVPDLELFRKVSIGTYGGPSQYFCPAEVYEIVTDPKTGEKDLRIHPANCVHCKTCDIKEPDENLEWTPPFGGDGPEYENM